ncbi:MAG: hypothetical protein OXF62_20380 [Caldilineaceae bacterium]|nr:hypothetical protein [Caldilineaceae bacterium]
MTTRDVYPSPLDCQAAAILADRVNDTILLALLESQLNTNDCHTLTDLFQALGLLPCPEKEARQ